MNGTNRKSDVVNMVLDIPIDQILPDPHQPRRKFKESELEELGGSIADQGLQQLPVVNPAFKKGGKDFYYIKAGERRWRTYVKRGLPSMLCVVEKIRYDGKRNADRRLAQAAENSSRVPLTHGEIIELVEEIVQEEIKKRGARHGAIQMGLVRVAKAFGQKVSWANGYWTLTGLVPELREMLDEDENGNRLNFHAATALAPLKVAANSEDADTQAGVLRDAEPYFKKGGHAAGYAFIVRRVREIRLSRGEKIQGRRARDEKAKLMRTVERMLGLANSVCGERHSTEYKKYVESLLDKMSVIEVDETLSNLKLGLQTFNGLLGILQAKREKNYKPFAIVKK
ncbi:MAG: ParB/RepB/Spo0J family partition protein [Minisyncoccia bacterium]